MDAKVHFTAHRTISRKAHPLESSRATLQKSHVIEYFDLLDNTLNNLGIIDEPSRVFNCDDSGFSGKFNSSKKVLVPKGVRHAYQSHISMSGHITMLNAISASGQTSPPLLICSGTLPRGNYNQFQFLRDG